MNNATTAQAKEQMVQDILRRCLYDSSDKFIYNNTFNIGNVRADCREIIGDAIMYANKNTVMKAFPQPIKDRSDLQNDLYEIERVLKLSNKNRNGIKFHKAFKNVWLKMNLGQRRNFLMKQSLTVLQEIRSVAIDYTAPVNYKTRRRLELVREMMKNKTKDKADETMRMILLLKGKTDAISLMNAYTNIYPLSKGKKQEELSQKMKSVLARHPNGTYVHNIYGLNRAYEDNKKKNKNKNK